MTCGSFRDIFGADQPGISPFGASPAWLRRSTAFERLVASSEQRKLNDLPQQPSPNAATLSFHADYIVQREPELTAPNEKIADATDDDGLEKELKGAAEYTCKISYAVSQARFLLRNAQQVPSAIDSVASGGTAAPVIDPVGASGGNTHTSRYRTVTLPKLQISAFSGSLHDWQVFWDHFNMTIHENTELLKIKEV